MDRGVQRKWRRWGNVVASAVILVGIFLACASCGLLNRPPTAVLEASHSFGVAPLEVAFDASGSSDPDGDNLSFEWDFGDGQNGAGVTVRHGYVDPGDYGVVLRVKDSRGAVALATKTLSVAAVDEQVADAVFDLQSGTNLSLGTGVHVRVAESATPGEVRLTASSNPAPTQPQEGYVEFGQTCTIRLEWVEPSSESAKASSASTTGPVPVTVSFDIPAGTDPASAEIVELTEAGYAIVAQDTGTGELPDLGATVSPDGTQLAIVTSMEISGGTHLAGARVAPSDLVSTAKRVFTIAFIRLAEAFPPYRPKLVHGSDVLVENGQVTQTLTARSDVMPVFGGVTYRVDVIGATVLACSPSTSPELLKPGVNKDMKLGFGSSGGCAGISCDARQAWGENVLDLAVDLLSAVPVVGDILACGDFIEQITFYLEQSMSSAASVQSTVYGLYKFAKLALKQVFKENLDKLGKQLAQRFAASAAKGSSTMNRASPQSNA